MCVCVCVSVIWYGVVLEFILMKGTVLEGKIVVKQTVFGTF